MCALALGYEDTFVPEPLLLLGPHGVGKTLLVELLAGEVGVEFEAVSLAADAVVIALGDMPLVTPETVRRLIAAYNPVEHRSICVPVYRGERGNPVLWGRQHFAALAGLEGDKGARVLFRTHSEEIVEVEILDESVLMDADTPEALARIRSAHSRGS